MGFYYTLHNGNISSLCSLANVSTVIEGGSVISFNKCLTKAKDGSDYMHI